MMLIPMVNPRIPADESRSDGARRGELGVRSRGLVGA
jgi:hypothetical protein